MAFPCFHQIHRTVSPFSQSRAMQRCCRSCWDCRAFWAEGPRAGTQGDPRQVGSRIKPAPLLALLLLLLAVLIIPGSVFSSSTVPLPGSAFRCCLGEHLTLILPATWLFGWPGLSILFAQGSGCRSLFGARPVLPSQSVHLQQGPLAPRAAAPRLMRSLLAGRKFYITQVTDWCWTLRCRWRDRAGQSWF